MSQSIGSSSGLMREEPAFMDSRTDRPPVTHRWPMHTAGQHAALTIGCVSVPNSSHAIPPPPEYPPPPLPTGPNDWILPADQQQSSIPHVVNGYPGSRTLSQEDQTVPHAYRLNGEQIEQSKTFQGPVILIWILRYCAFMHYLSSNYGTTPSQWRFPFLSSILYEE